MRKLFLFIILVALCCGRAAAQENTVVVAPPDTTFVHDNDDGDDYQDNDTDRGGLSPQVQGDTLLTFRLITPARDTVEGWKKTGQFAYMQNLDSMLREMQRQKQDEAAKPAERRVRPLPSSGGSIFNSGIFRILAWSIAILFVGFILYQLFLSKGIFKVASTKKKVTEDETEVPENIADNDFERLLRQSYLAGDLRMAARYLFLKTLQKLNLRELISFAADKTNSDYMYELPEAKRDSFSSLALYYEYIWYGNMPVSKEDFDKIETRYNQFLNAI